MSDDDYQAGWDAGFRKGLSAIEAGFTAHDMAQAREEGYSAGAQRAAQYESILTDLIAELRSLMDESYAGLLNEVPNHALWEAVVHAEARLRELDTPTGKPNERIN